MRDSTHILSISALAATLTAAASDYTFNTEDYTATAQFIGFTKSPIQPTSSNHYYGNSTYTSGISSQSYPNSGVYTNNSTQSYSKMYLSTDIGIDSNISSSRGASLATNGLYTTFNVNSTAAGKVTLQQSDLKTSTLSSLSSVGTTTATTSSLTSNMSTANKSYVSSTSTTDSVSLAGTTSTTYSSIMSSSSNTSGTTSTDSQSKTTSTTSSLSNSTLKPLTSSTTTSQKEAIATSSSTESISTTTSKSVSSTSSAFITSSSSEVSSSTSKPSTTSSSSEHTTSSTTTKESSTSTISTSTKKPSTSSSSTTTSSTSISTTTSDAANYGSTSPVDPLSVDPKIAAYQEIGNIGYLLDEDDSALLLKLHNDVRSLHEDTPDLVWNNTLVAQSYEYMQYLINEDPAYSPCSGNLLHSGGKFGSNVGENLAAATGIDDLTTLFDLWSSEGQYYDYDNPSLTGGTDDSTELGHFTQLVWKGTTAVGCGVQVCTDSDWTYLICRYYTEGNILYSGDTWKLFKQNVLPLSS